ncbi:MAG: GNAT family N-acetyltransferase [Gaiellaceae bacterium]
MPRTLRCRAGSDSFPLAQRHLPALELVIEDPAILANTRVPEPVPAGFVGTWLERYEEGRRDGTREAFAIEGDDDTFLGLALVPRIERPARTVELGYLLAPAARGRGVATEALMQLTEWAFAELGAIRIELLIATHNEPSKRVAERCGYVREGVLRSAHLKQEVRQDTEVWSRLRSDP